MGEDQPLKILMTADTVGGVWTYAIDLIQELEVFGAEVALATMGKLLSDNQRAQISLLTHVKLYESSFKLEWMEDPWADVEAAGNWLLEINKEFNPDIIHLNDFSYGNLSWRKPVVMVFHSCVLSWWQAVKNETAPASWQMYQEKVKAGLQAASLVIAPSHAMLEEALVLYGPFQKHKVIYNGRNPDKFLTNTKESFIFSMGRVWDEAKNIQLLTSIALDLDWPVYVAGDATHPATGENLQLNNVHFLGRLNPEDIQLYLAKAAIYALPTKYEPFGLSILEAALSGCALVLSNIPTQKEIWGQAATYVDPTQPEDLKLALHKLIWDENTRTKMGTLAKERGQKYKASQMAAEYQATYQEFLKGKLKPIPHKDFYLT